ncbi:flagellar basal body rod protein FlgB [Achromobacter sp. F4_2707]|uniref:flagellar basal body rod protein FlgB n=1 Tax=Achromobacter sp. F4_2707 TaxID=3114286 RepID=UPI0039C72C25
MFDRIGENFDFNQTVLQLRQQRQEVLSANIANADTPHYKARDFDFTKALEEAMGGGGSLRLPATELSLTSARHIPGSAAAGKGTAELLYRQPFQPSLDGNTVDMDVERVQFADNTARYQADLSIISARLRSLRSVFEQ